GGRSMLSLLILSMGLVPADTGESPAELAAWIDTRMDAVARAKGLPARPAADDEMFLRRAYLELAGTIPSVADARDFLESASGGKRERLIQTLLDDKRFAEHFARLWARTLAPAGNTRAPLEAYLRSEFGKNTPFDQVAKSILTAKGDAATVTPASFYSAVGNTPERVAEAVARGFLGIRVGCAQCHNHPFASWKREHFWGMAAFFAGTNAAPGRVTDSFATKITPMDGKQEFEAKFLEG